MGFNKTELLVLQHLGTRINDIISAIKKSKSQVYRAIQSLERKDVIIISKEVLPKHSHILLLANILKKNPGLLNVLHDSATDFLITLDMPRTVSDSAKRIGVKNVTLYKVISKLRKFNILRKENSKYYINPLFNEFIELSENMRTYYMNIDDRIPIGSDIYMKNRTEILFSNNQSLSYSLTAFSRYSEFGISVITRDNYYYLPKKSLGIKEIFIHSLYIVEKETNSIILVALFYLKNKRKLSGIEHFILDNIRKIFNGEKISGYPTLSEIKMKAEEYDIAI